MNSLPLPRNLEELESQLELFHAHSEKMDHLDWVEHEYDLKFKGGFKGNPFEDVGFNNEASQAIIDSWREIKSAIPNVRKHLNQEHEGKPRGQEFDQWRRGRGSPYPLVWNVEKFEEFERMIEEADQLEDWVRWLLRGMRSGTDNSYTDDSLEFSSSVLKQAQNDADKKGEDLSFKLLWDFYPMPTSFRQFLEQQKDNLPRNSIEEKPINIKPAPKKDAILKIRIKDGLSTLKSIFSDLEQQKFVFEGTTAKLEDHFTGYNEFKEVPDEASPIEWRTNLYELRTLLRSFRASRLLDEENVELAKHFIREGQVITRKQLERGPKETEKLERLGNILSKYDINIRP